MTYTDKQRLNAILLWDVELTLSDGEPEKWEAHLPVTGKWYRHDNPREAIDMAIRDLIAIGAVVLPQPKPEKGE